MSNYQVLQFQVQYTYDAASLKQIQTALNNLEAVVKIRLDDEGVVKQLNKIAEGLKGGSSTLKEVKKSLDSVKDGMKKTFSEGEESVKKYEKTLKDVESVGSKGTDDPLVRKYKSQATELVALQDKINAYKIELGKLEEAEKSGIALSDEQKMRQQGLQTALTQTQQAYNQQRASVVQSVQSERASTDELANSTKALSASYSSQLAQMAQYDTQITAIKSKIAELNSVKARDGSLTKEQQAQQVVLQQQLANTTAERNKLRNSIVKNEQAQANASKKSEQSAKDIIDSYADQAKSVADLVRAQEQLKAEIKTLEAAQKSSSGITDEQRERLAALKLAYKELGMNLQQAQRDAVSQNRATRDLGNSYNDIQKRMAALSAEIRNTQDPMGKNKESVQKMQKEYDMLNTKLKKMDSAMGNNQRNVGNYTDSIRRAASTIAVFQGPLGPLAGRLNSLATTLKQVKEAQQATDGTTRTLTGSIMRLVGMTGLGLLIVALASVRQFLTKTERGQRAAAIASAGLTAVMNTLGDVVIKVGEFIFKAFQNPKKSISELWAGIQSFTKNILKPTEVFEKVRDSINAVFDDPKTAVKNLWEVIKENLITRFNSVLDTFGYAGKAMQAAFNLDWETFNENAKAAGSSIVDVVTGVEGTVSKVKESTIALGGAIVKGLQPALDFAVDLGEQIKENVAIQREEEGVLFDMQKRQRELNVARAEQDYLIQQSRRFVRENRHEMIEGMRILDDTIAKEKALGEEIMKKFEEELEIQRARTERFESDVSEKDKLAEMEAEYYRMLADNETKMMRLQRDRNTVETRFLNMQFKAQKDYLKYRLDSMKHENQVMLDSRRGLLNQLNVAEKAHSEVFGNEQLKREMQFQYFVEESRRLQAAGFTEEEAMRRAKANSAIRIEQEQNASEKALIDIRRKYNESLFDAIQDAAFSSGKAIFGDRKLIASGETVIDTYKGAQRAFAANPNPIGIAQAAAIVAKGVIALRQINSAKPGDKNVSGAGSGASVAKAPTESFGLVDATQLVLPTEIASQLSGNQPQVTNNIILEGELDSELLALKVRDGNNTISAQTVSV